MDGLAINSRMEASVAGAGQAPAGWGEFLARHPEATIYHDSRWGAVFQESYKFRPIYLTAGGPAPIRGTLLLVRQKAFSGKARWCSLPYFDGSGILADDSVVANSLLNAAEKLCRERRRQTLEIRQYQPLGLDLPTRGDKVTLVLGLPPNSEQLWAQVGAKVRNLVRKAEKSELAARQGGSELLPWFYEVYARTMRDLGSPPHSLRFFQILSRYFSQEVRVYAVSKDTQPLAAGLALRDRQILRVPWAGNDWRYRNLNANMLLYWTMLKDACEQGVNKFDFGRSTRDSGTYHFKTQWGATEVPLAWHIFQDAPEKAALADPHQKYATLVRAWKKLPLCLSNWLGPRIIRRFS